MTIQEYIDKNRDTDGCFCLEVEGYKFKITLDSDRDVAIGKYNRFMYAENIKTMEQFSQLCELLTGKPFDYE